MTIVTQPPPAALMRPAWTASWRYAKDRDVKCDEKDGKWICKRAAEPCKDVLHRMLDGAATAAKANCKDELAELLRRQEEVGESGAGGSPDRLGD